MDEQGGRVGGSAGGRVGPAGDQVSGSDVSDAVRDAIPRPEVNEDK